MVKCLLFTFIICWGNLTYSQIEWHKTNGPFGGEINDIAFGYNNKIYAGTSSGVYKTTNNGTSWSLIGLANKNISAVYVSSSGKILAGTDTYPSAQNDGIYYSIDEQNWHQSNIQGRYINDIIKNSNYLFASGDWVLRSSDDGISWSNIGTINYCDKFAVNSLGHIYMTTLGNGILKSTDNGNNWLQLTIPYQSISSISINSLGYIFASWRWGSLYRSTNDGNSWITINHPNIYKVTSVTSGPGGDLYVGTVYEGVWHSSDYGNSWNNGWFLDTNATYVSTVAAKSDSEIYSGFYNYHSIYKTINRGVNWIQIDSGLSASFVHCITKAPNGDMYAGTANGIHKSVDNGNNWFETNIRSKDIRSISIKDNYILAAGCSIYCSTNNGFSWQDISTIEYPCAFLSSLITTNNNFFIGFSAGVMLKSTNQGNVWSNNYTFGQSIEGLDKNLSGQIFAATTAGVYFSPNNGNSWTFIFNTTYNQNYLNAIKISSSGEIYAGGDNGLYKSSNNGNNWEYTNLPGKIHSIEFAQNGQIFSGLFNTGVFQYNQNTWSQISTGLDNKSIFSLGFNSQNYLLAGTFGAGIYMTSVPITVSTVSNIIPKFYKLFQNIPNPFNPSTKIKFDISKSSDVILIIYGVLGTELIKLVNTNLKSGSYAVDWDGSYYPSGIYFCHLSAGDFSDTKKLILLK